MTVRLLTRLRAEIDHGEQHYGSTLVAEMTVVLNSCT